MRHFLYLCSRLQKKQNCFFLGTFIFLTTKNHCEQFIICQKLNKLSFWFATYKVVTLMSSTLNSKCSVMQHLTVWSDRFTVQIHSDFIMSEDSFIHSLKRWRVYSCGRKEVSRDKWKKEAYICPWEQVWFCKVEVPVTGTSRSLSIS